MRLFCRQQHVDQAYIDAVKDDAALELTKAQDRHRREVRQLELHLADARRELADLNRRFRESEGHHQNKLIEVRDELERAYADLAKLRANPVHADGEPCLAHAENEQLRRNLARLADELAEREDRPVSRTTYVERTKPAEVSA